MIVAITAKDGVLNSEVDPRFGRAAFFVIADTDTLEARIIDNSESVNASSGAGTGAAQTLSELGVDALYTGQVGPKASEVLKAAGIECHQGTTGTVADVLNAVTPGQAAPDAPSKAARSAAAAEAVPVEAPEPGAIRVAVPADDTQGLKAPRSGHFGRCNHYSLVDIKDGGIVNVQSRPNADHVEGGCMGPVMLLKGWAVSVVIVSGIGGRPLQGFNEQGIEVFAGQGATVSETIVAYIRGELPPMGSDQVCGGRNG